MAENTQNYEFESKKLLNEQQFEVAVRLEALEGKPIKKVLSLKAIPKIVSSEKVGDNVTFSGKTAYNVVYLAEDQTLRSLYLDAEWQGKITSEVDVYYLACQCADSVVTGFSSSEITISTLNSVQLFGLKKEVISCVDGLGENYVASIKNHEYERVVNFASASFNEVAEQEYPSKLTDVLQSSCEVVLDEAVSGIDTVTLSGRAFVTTNVLEGEKVVCLSKVIDFKEELNALSATLTNVVDASVVVSALKVSASVSDIDNKTNLIFAVELQANAVVYQKESVSLVEDAFSLTKNVNTSCECVLKENYDGDIKVENDFVSSFDAGVDLENVLMVSSAKPVLSETTYDEAGTYVSGVVEVELIGEVEGGEKLVLNNIVPFSMHLENLGKDAQTLAMLKNVTAKLKSKTEVELEADVVVVSKNYSSEFVGFVKDIEETDDKPADDATIRVYVTDEGEDMFAVAKKLNMKIEDIVSQNPSASDGLEEGTRLVVYSPLNIKFE